MTLSRTTDHGPPLTVGSLFTGVGGFDLGLECAGMDVVWQVENDKWCRQVLRARWPDVDLYGDVKDVTGADSAAGGERPPEQGGGEVKCRDREAGRSDVHPSRDEEARRGVDTEGEDDGRTELAPVDLICGGFPCQDVSVAGRRAGLDAERSGLFFEFVRIADSVAPRWLLVENVPGLLSSNDGEDFATVLAELTGFHPEVPEDGWEDGGFCEGPKRRCFWRVLDTQHFGPPQRRRRVFLVCDSRARCGPEVLLERSCVPGNPQAQRASGENAPTLFGSGAGTSRVASAGSESEFIVGWRDRAQESGEVTAMDGELNPADDTMGPVTAAAAHQNRGPVALYYSHDYSRDRIYSAEGVAPAQNPTQGAGAAHVYPMLEVQARMLVHENLSGSVPRRERATSLREGASHSYQFVEQAIPRRLTPRECERLQGFPDDWARWGYLPEVDDMTFEEIVAGSRSESVKSIPDGFRTEISDTQRYKQMGNAVSVPVAAWIGSRIVAAEMGAVESA